MGVLSRLLASDVPDHMNRDNTLPHWWSEGGSGTQSGMRVTPDRAMTIAAVWSAVRLVTEAVAMLPLITYRRLEDDGKTRARNHPLYDVLHNRPNRWQTSFEFRQMMQAHVELRGNGYAHILPGPRGAVDQLIPIHPDRVIVEQLDDWSVIYRVSDLKGRQTVLLDDEMFHLRGLSMDGISGVSTITYARESMGLALAAEGYGAKVFSQDARPGGVLSHPKELNSDMAKRIALSWQQAHGGVHNSHKVAVLEEGMQWQQVGMTSEDAQFLESRKFQIAEIARWFRVPPHMIGDLERATFSNIEEMSLEFVTYSLMSRLVRWEQAINRSLILAPQTYFAEFLVDGLLRGDFLKRQQGYAIGRTGGWFSPNDVRKKENMNPIPGGDTYMQPMNMEPLGTAPAQENASVERNGHYAEAIPE